ncbi:chloride channel protein [Saccharopolyspora spinosa]|uniref:CIC family chloride channel protein n=1 Tax=Saccharopolyspora spinosa TaxID=60894 RepID=A0A2N3Y6V7_SACSN|nr:chloride channel protein [Saccharopolyspora spinosa]PKW18598.1 CIC family chloride channel protein [Saccharopolyspora spinosa]
MSAVPEKQSGAAPSAPDAVEANTSQQPANSPMPDRLEPRPRRAAQRLRSVWNRSYLIKWVPVSIVIGAVAGLGSIALYGLLHLVTVGALGQLAQFHPATVAGDGAVQHYSDIGRPWLVPLLVAGGALVSALLIRWLAPEAGGHGTDAAIHALHHDPKGMRGRVTVVKMAASALTLGTGGSGGTEGPAAQISAAFGSVVARAFRFTPAEARIAVAAGLAAGVGAIFRAPLGGALLGVEMLYRRDMAAEMLLPSLIASIVAYLEFGAVYGFGAMFGDQPGNPPGITQFPLFLLLGVAAGVAARCYVWAFHRTKAFFDRRRKIPTVLKPVIGGVAVGALGLLLPEMLGTSYGLVQLGLDKEWVLSTSLWVLLALPAAKIVGTALTVGSGGSAGVFGPGMVLGAAMGIACWRLLVLAGIPVDDPVPFVIVGMAACLGSAIHSPIALTVMVAEITGTADALFPTMVAVTAATLVMGNITLYPSQPRTRVDAPTG